MRDDSLALRTIRDLHELESVRAIWESWPGSRDSDLDFFCSTVRSRGSNCRPHIIVLTRNAQPDAILIGRCERRKLRFRLGSFTICQPEVNVLELVYGGLRGNAHVENCAVLVREIIRSLDTGVADLALWKQLEVQSPMYNCVLKLPNFALRDHSGWLHDHWWLRNFPKGREAFLMSLGRNQRSKLQRKYKKVLTRFAGEVQVHSFRSVADLAPAIADMETIASKTDKRKLFGDGFFDTPQIRDQMTATAEKGWLRIYILYLEGKPAAFWMGTLYDRCLQGDHTGYDPVWSEFSPGIFLFLSILEDLREEDIRTIDFGYGNTQLRQCFGDLRRVESRVQIYAPTARGIKLNLLRTVTCRATDCVKTLVRWTHRLELASRSLRNQFASQHRKYFSTLPDRFRSAAKGWAG
jgi:CelD/BcsL family acetyltransferase involved in cellulose biosynthesis